jgi:DNA-binding IclR family transcriptional regulator
MPATPVKPSAKRVTPRSRHNVADGGLGTLVRGLRLLRILGDQPEGMRFTDVVARANLARATTHRLLAALVSEGYVEFDEATRLYSLGLQVFELSHRVGRVRSAADTARPFMSELANATGCTVTLNVLDGDHMVVVERVHAPSNVRIGTEIGSREAIYSTSTGKVVLASLPSEIQAKILQSTELRSLTPKTITKRRALMDELARVADQQFALADEENEIGVRAVAVRIPIASGQRQAALALAAPSFVMSSKDLLDRLAPLRAAAQAIGTRLTAQ